PNSKIDLNRLHPYVGMEHLAQPGKGQVRKNRYSPSKPVGSSRSISPRQRNRPRGMLPGIQYGIEFRATLESLPNA
ncbi:MAG: hypothetical protein QF516_08575, partial [Pirellulaceae bacterium]|nr:hypothetical protein [Pirellulaceae bacterium]